MTLLVVAAARFEAEQSLSVLKSVDPTVEFFELGVGPLPAAKAEAALLEKCRGKDVLYIGSCGSFYPFEGLHLTSADEVHWMPPCMRTGIASYPEEFSMKPFQCPESPLELPRKSVLTTPSISLVDHFAPEVLSIIPHRNSLTENMELYCVMGALLQARSLHTILGVTNQVGPEGSRQWEANFREIAKMTAEFISRERNLRILLRDPSRS